MRKYFWLIGILVIALLVVPFVVGCGNKQQSESVPPEPPQPGEMSAEKPNAAGEGANTLGDLMKKQGKLSSYIVSMDTGTAKMSYAMKMANGKPVAMKMDTGQGGWMIIRLDKKIHYMYSPATKSVMSMPMTGVSPGTASKGPVPSAEAMKALVGQKVTSEKVDGVDCLKVTSANGADTYWVEKKYGLPVQLKNGDKTMKFKYKQINSVPDSTFEVPAGTKIQEMPNMPGMQGMPNPHGTNPHSMPSMPKMPK